MSEVSVLRLYLLRAMYLLIAVGMGLTIWPLIISPPDMAADSKTVVRAFLGALTLLCAWGIRYPLRMLPLLIFELLWKVIWVAAFGLPLWLTDGLDASGQETLFATMVGVVLVPLVLPWGYVYRNYFRAPGEAWTKAKR
jgi:hypothetical protein